MWNCHFGRWKVVDSQPSLLWFKKWQLRLAEHLARVRCCHSPIQHVSSTQDGAFPNQESLYPPGMHLGQGELVLLCLRGSLCLCETITLWLLLPVSCSFASPVPPGNPGLQLRPSSQAAAPCWHNRAWHLSLEHPSPLLPPHHSHEAATCVRNLVEKAV